MKLLPLLLVAAVPLVAGCGSSDSGPAAAGGAASAGAPGNNAGSPNTGGAGSGNVAGSGSGGAAAGSGGAVGTSGGSAGASAGSGNGGTSTGGTGAAGSAGGAGKGGAGGGGGTLGGGGAGGRGGSTSGGSGGSAAGGAGGFVVTTPAFANQPGCGPMPANGMCATFPRNNTNFGTNISPAMSWTGAPAGTQSFAVVLQDIAFPNTHWVLWNIPASVTSLAENVPKGSAMPAMPAGSQQAGLGTGDGYFGPGACGNVYEFSVYALSVPTFSPTMATDQARVRTQLLALGASILGTASMRARSFAPNCP